MLKSDKIDCMLLLQFNLEVLFGKKIHRALQCSLENIFPHTPFTNLRLYELDSFLFIVVASKVFGGHNDFCTK